MRRLYREMVRLLEQGQDFAVATIFDKVGSVPRSAGAKMVVRAGVSIFGTIGGGRLEADAMRLAKEALHELGHTLGLRHCDDWRCAMASSHAVERLDLKEAQYCRQCAQRLGL